MSSICFFFVNHHCFIWLEIQDQTLLPKWHDIFILLFFYYLLIKYVWCKTIGKLEKETLYCELKFFTNKTINKRKEIQMVMIKKGEKNRSFGLVVQHSTPKCLQYQNNGAFRKFSIFNTINSYNSVAVRSCFVDSLHQPSAKFGSCIEKKKESIKQTILVFDFSVFTSVDVTLNRQFATVAMFDFPNRCSDELAINHPSSHRLYQPMAAFIRMVLFF